MTQPGARKSDLQRAKILQAAISIVCEEGLRGLTYRAVASKAGVSVGSVSYYFNSMDDISLGAYELFQSSTHSYTRQLLETANQHLMSYLRSDAPKKEKVDVLVENVSKFVSNYVWRLAHTELDDRKVEAAFMHAAIINPVIKDIISERNSEFRKATSDWFANYGHEYPDQAAEVFLGTLNYLERICVLDSKGKYKKSYVKKTTDYMFKALLS